MALKEIQNKVDSWVNKTKIGYFQPLEIMTRLIEEVGELAREVNHQYGPKKKKAGERKQEIGDEIADTFFTLTCLANSLGIDLDDSFDKMMEKLQKRDGKRWEKK